MPVPFLVLILAAIAVGLVLTRTAFGISVYMLGSNLEATRYSGVDTRRVLIGIYTLSSVLCFVAACLMLARFNSASAGYAQSYLLVTILAAVHGRGRPVRRLRADLRADAGADRAAGDLLGLQPARASASTSPSRSGA